MMTPHLRPMITCVIALGCLYLLASCSTDEPVDPGIAIHQSYEMEYDVARDRTTGRASIRANNETGAQMQVGTPTDLLYNSVAMGWTSVEPFGYVRIQTGRVETGTFEYKDAAGVVHNNSVTLSSIPPIAFPSGLNELSIAAPVEVVWQGAAVSTGEMVSLIFTTPTNGLARFYQPNAGATSISLSVADLNQVGIGTATWRIERSRSFSLQSPSTAGGFIGIRWSTGDRPVTLK